MLEFEVEILVNKYTPARTNCAPDDAYPSDWELDYRIPNLPLHCDKWIVDESVVISCYGEELEVDFTDLVVHVVDGALVLELIDIADYYHDWIERTAAEHCHD